MNSGEKVKGMDQSSCLISISYPQLAKRLIAFRKHKKSIAEPAQTDSLG